MRAVCKADMPFVEVLEKHMEDLKDTRYKAIQCMIATAMLTTGVKIWEIELVEEYCEQEVRFSVRKK